MTRLGRTLILSLLAPTYAVWREAEAAGRVPHTPFRRFRSLGFLLQIAFVVLGLVTVAVGLAADIRLVAWIGISWLVAAGLMMATRLLVPASWAGSEERFHAVFSIRGLVRVAVIVLLVLSLAHSNWLGSVILAFALGGLWMQGFVPVLLIRWLERRRRRYVG